MTKKDLIKSIGYCPTTACPKGAIFILENGREHSMVIEEITETAVLGRWGIFRKVILHRQADGTIHLVVDTVENVKRLNNLNVLFDGGCWLPQPNRIVIDLRSIFLGESPESVVLVEDPNTGGVLDQKKIVAAYPELMEAIKLATQPEAARPQASQPIPQPPVRDEDIDADEEEDEDSEEVMS